MKPYRLISRILSLVLISAIAACGSGGGGKSQSSASASSSSSSGVIKPQPVSNKVSIKVEGLKGALELANGSDNLQINKDGAWQFKLPVEVGISYNVQFVKQPEQQICTMKYGWRVMVTAPLVVEIACSDGFGVGLDITKPKDYGLKNLQVVSNYQQLGGAGDLLLTLDSKIKTTKNSFIALRNATADKTYFLAYIYADTLARIKLDPQSTALALLLTEPAVTQAIYSRQMDIGEFYNHIAPLDGQKNPQLEGDLKKLADEIARQADKDVDLFGPQTTIGPFLERAIVFALDKLSAKPLVPVVDGKSVALSVTLPTPGNLNLVVNNPQDRTIVLSGLKGSVSSALIEGNSSFTTSQSVPADQFYSLNLSYFGPGKLGSVNALDADFKRAILRSSLVDYFLPNLAYFSGGKAPSKEIVVDCLKQEDWADLEADAATVYPAVQSFIEQDNYFRPYFAFAEKYRGFWADSDNMDKLLSCSSIGLAGLSKAESVVAKSHLTSLLKGVNKLRESSSVKEDLFRSEKQAHFTAALFQNNTTGLLNSTNAFSVEASVPNDLDDETEAEFSGRCLDASSKVITCTLTWTFEGTVVTGSVVRHKFNKANNQVVNLVASDSSGLRISKDLLVKVTLKSAAINLAKKNTDFALDLSKPVDFDKVFIGTELPKSFVITNNGNSKLDISSVVIEGSFRTNLTALSIAAGESKEFDVWFVPTQSQDYPGALAISSNDKSQPKLIMPLFGKGTGKVPPGNYEITEGGQTRTEVVAATNETAISGDEEFAQIRLFGRTDEIFPHVYLRLLNFTGPGIYSLADIDADKDGMAEESCLALYAAVEDDYTEQYCAGTGTPPGTLVVTEIDAQTYQVDYDFSAANCLISNGGVPCTSKVIQLRGSAKVDKAILQPPKIVEE